MVLAETEEWVDLVVLVGSQEHQVLEALLDVVEMVEMLDLVPLSRNQEILGLVLAAVVEEAAVVPEELDLVMLDPIMQGNREEQDLLGELVNLVLPVNQGKKGHQEVLEQLRVGLVANQEVLSPLK